MKAATARAFALIDRGQQMSVDFFPRFAERQRSSPPQRYRSAHTVHPALATTTVDHRLAPFAFDIDSAFRKREMTHAPGTCTGHS